MSQKRRFVLSQHTYFTIASTLSPYRTALRKYARPAVKFLPDACLGRGNNCSVSCSRLFLSTFDYLIVLLPSFFNLPTLKHFEQLLNQCFSWITSYYKWFEAFIVFSGFFIVQVQPKQMVSVINFYCMTSYSHNGRQAHIKCLRESIVFHRSKQSGYGNRLVTEKRLANLQ